MQMMVASLILPAQLGEKGVVTNGSVGGGAFLHVQRCFAQMK